MWRSAGFCVSVIIGFGALRGFADAAEVEVVGLRAPNRWSSQGNDSPREAAIGRPDGRLIVKVKNGDTILFRNEAGTHGVIFEKSKAEKAAGTWEVIEGELTDVTAADYPNFNAAIAQTTKPKGAGRVIRIQINALASGPSSGILFACDDHSLGADPERQSMLGVVILEVEPPLGGIVDSNGGINGSIFFDFGPGNEVFPFGFRVFLREVKSGLKSEAVLTDAYGRFRLVAPRPGSYQVAWNDPNWGEGRSQKVVEITDRVKHLTDIAIKPPAGAVRGKVVMADGSSPYFSNGLGLEATAYVSILDANERVIKGPVPANANGLYAIAGLPRTGAINIRAHLDEVASEKMNIAQPANDDLGAPINLRIMTLPARIKKLREKAAQPRGAIEADPVPPATGFLLQKGIGSETGAAKYYSVVDPKRLRGTLSEWWKVNGFDEKNGSAKGAARAAFLNDTDLGVGRDMHLLLGGGGNTTGNVAAFVTNYFEKVMGTTDTDFQNELNADLAFKADLDNSGATVCMEYSPVEGEPTKKPVVKFFAYESGRPDAKRIDRADLDDVGEKFLPNLCLNCHGGDFSETFPKADLASSFREFDLATYKYPRFDTMGNSLPRNAPERLTPTADEQRLFKQMNDIVVASSPTDSIKQIVTLWYQGGATVQDPMALPPGWEATPASPGLPDFYRNVVAKSCRTCHVALGGLGDNELSWVSYSQFLAPDRRGDIQRRFCALSLPMPHAKITYGNFWRSNQPDLLRNFSADGWAPLGPCP